MKQIIIRDQSLEDIVAAKKESKQIEFKEGFDPNSLQDWCETIKDIVAIANSGGGYILFGVKNDGSPSDWDCSQLLQIDPAKVTDKLPAHIGEHFSEFEILEAERTGRRAALMRIQAVHIPLIFAAPGTYPIAGGKQKTAFSRGTVYFRHGAKSEPGTSQDIRQSIRREIDSIRKSWLGGIRKIVTAPAEHVVKVLPPEVVESTLPSATPIRLVDDPEAPAYRRLDPDMTHLYRQKEVIEEINGILHGKPRVTSYDVQCVRKAYKVNTSKPDFCHEPKFASPQYSQSFVEWMVIEFRKDPSFFEKARIFIRKWRPSCRFCVWALGALFLLSFLYVSVWKVISKATAVANGECRETRERESRSLALLGMTKRKGGGEKNLGCFFVLWQLYAGTEAPAS